MAFDKRRPNGGFVKRFLSVLTNGRSMVERSICYK